MGETTYYLSKRSQALWKQCVGHKQSDSLLCAWPSDSTGDEEQVGLTFIENNAPGTLCSLTLILPQPFEVRTNILIL